MHFHKLTHSLFYILVASGSLYYLRKDLKQYTFLVKLLWVKDKGATCDFVALENKDNEATAALAITFIDSFLFESEKLPIIRQIP